MAIYKKYFSIFFFCLLVVSAAVYLPGLNGPYFFDDNTNLLGNPYVRIKTLDYTTIYQAAFSLTAGPLQRPISMASFAINYFFAGSFDNPIFFKSVNVAIHILNGFLIYCLTQIILARVASSRSNARSSVDPRLGAAVIALVWLIHPIQLTSVLYVVQRMTELAALFSLLGLLFYINGRNCFLRGRKARGTVLVFLAFAVCWPLGLYSKETAVLLPLFILVIEYTLFAKAFPWSRWPKLSQSARRALLISLALIVVASTMAAVIYALPAYALRTFTMTERLMTEARVLIFYVSLILIPRLDAFGLFHDDIDVSTSLFFPWTTLPSILLVVSSILAGLFLRKKYPLVSLGILWFFVGHLIESTLFSLEIAHEHRNYLPSLGILLAVMGIISESKKLRTLPYPKTVLVLAILILGTITTLRSSQWSSEREMAYYEALHHPDSAASTTRYASVLLSDGRFEESIEQMNRVTKLAPHEAGYLMSVQAVKVTRGGHVDLTEHQEIMRRLTTYPINAMTLNQMGTIGDCITTTCTALKPFFSDWTQAVLRNSSATELAFLYFLRGRSLLSEGKLDEAVEAYKRSNELDQNYLNPLFDLTELYIAAGRSDYATVVLSVIRDVNERIPHKRDRDIKYLAEKIAKQQASARGKVEQKS